LGPKATGPWPAQREGYAQAGKPRP